MDKSKILDTAMKMYSEVRSYDVHYSTIRTTVATFFIGLSTTLGGFLISRNQHALAIVFPTGLLVMATYLTFYFQRLIDYCLLAERRLEDLMGRMIREGYVPQGKDLDDLKFRDKWHPSRFPPYKPMEAGNLVLLAFTVLYLIASILFTLLGSTAGTIDCGT